MNLLDANVALAAYEQLRGWKIAVRQIGVEIGDSAADDSAIVPILHSIARATFFTQDRDFWSAELCHPAYCIVFLDTRFQDAARFIRAFLRHPAFDTHARRLGKVVRVHPDRLTFFDSHRGKAKQVGWLRAV